MMEFRMSWENFFGTAFTEIKKQLNEHYRVEEDGSGPPEIVAIKELVGKLPCAVKIVMLKVDPKKFPHLEDDNCPLFIYDFSRLAEVIVDYLGLVDADDREKLKEILTEHFPLENLEAMVEDFCAHLRVIGFYEPELPDVVIHFLFYDPRKELDKFVRDFVLHFETFFGGTVAKRYEEVIDYNKVFNLRSGTIYPAQELLEQDQRIRSFARFNGDSKPPTVEDFQADVASIQLIPAVPEEAKRVFNRAKELYIFGYFRYEFFTISRHYAHLALESAIKNRYYQSLGSEVILTNKKGKNVRFGRIDHQRVIDFCYRNRKDGWNYREVYVDGKKFAFTKEELLDYLVQNDIITMWEKRLCKRGLRQRDLLSHPTSSPIDFPGMAFRSIKEVAALINKMFSTMDRKDLKN